MPVSRKVAEATIPTIVKTGNGREVHLAPEDALLALKKVDLNPVFPVRHYTHATTDNGSILEVCIVAAAKTDDTFFSLVGFVCDHPGASSMDLLEAMCQGVAFSGRYSLASGQPA